MPNDDRSADGKGLYDELVTIKKLLILGLARSGTSQRAIAKAIGVNQSTISRMVPTTTEESTNEGARRTGRPRR